MTRPDLSSVPEFYRGYVNQVKDHDLFSILLESNQTMVELVRNIPETKGEFRYAPEKWTIKELLCHIMDAERIFAYRALRFARNDKTALPGFEENNYAPQANAHGRTFLTLAQEMKRLRETTIDLYTSFTPDMLLRSGTASNVVLSVLNLGFIIPGHETHHRKVLETKYLSNNE
jgi:uncharacterized damage-inducible protein DinB